MKDTIKASVKKAQKDGKVYYNIIVEVEGMKVQVAPKFLNNKQKALLNHKLARAVGDEKHVNK